MMNSRMALRSAAVAAWAAGLVAGTPAAWAAGPSPSERPAGADVSDAASAPNTGQDVTNPVKRVDLRVDDITPGSGQGLHSWVLILRHDQPLVLSQDWKLGLRFDLPITYNNVPSGDNPAGGYKTGLGDALIQGVFIKTIDKRQAVGFGTQLILPTATADQFGTGYWRLAPTLDYRYALPEISRGSFFLAAVRYDFNFAGAGHGGNISNVQVSPTLNIALPNTMFLTFNPSTDIRYNFISNSWFVPADVMIGKLWRRKIVTSLELAAPLYSGATPSYKFKAEARIGYFF
jgi:hypothetical protein